MSKEGDGDDDLSAIDFPIDREALGLPPERRRFGKIKPWVLARVPRSTWYWRQAKTKRSTQRWRWR